MEQSQLSQKTASQSWAIPIAIIFGFGLIALAIYFTGSGRAPITAGSAATADERPAAAQTERQPISVVSPDDFIRGNPNAPIVIVEYSDYDCPFCQRFHNTMKSVLAGQHGQDGSVAWVYRHLPIQNLHPNAPAIAHASECVAEETNTETFWQFSDLYYEQQGKIADLAMITDQLDGVTPEFFAACMEEQRHVAAIQNDMKEATLAGGNGTPFNVFIFDEPMSEPMQGLIGQINSQFGGDALAIISDTQLAMSGAFPEEVIEQLIAAYKGI